MYTRDYKQVIGMMVAVLIVFSIARQIDNGRKTRFIDDYIKIHVYDINRSSARGMADDELAGHLAIAIDDPGHFFQSLTHSDDQIIWESDYYARFYRDDGSFVDGEFSTYAHIMRIDGSEGMVKFELRDPDNWIFY